MPMYEYVCMKCEEHFEELVRGDQEVACPQCGATNVARPQVGSEPGSELLGFFGRVCLDPKRPS